MRNGLTPRATKRRRGFTLVEMLIVILIIGLLVALAFPVINRARRSADRTRTAADLQTIATALEQYRSDHRDYPRHVTSNDTSPTYVTGAQLLCWALIAPGDGTLTGQDGPGFRARPGGRTWGPYLQADLFRLEREDPTEQRSFVMLDRYDRPILYFPARAVRPNINAADGFVAESSNALYDASYNLRYVEHPGRPGEAPVDRLRRIQVMLGDYNVNGGIDPDESPAYTGPFILWSAGRTEDDTTISGVSRRYRFFGPADVGTNPDANRRAAAAAADITNFR